MDKNVVPTSQVIRSTPITESKAEIVTQEAARQTVHWVPKIGFSFLIFFAFWIAAALSARFIRRLTQRGKETRQVVFRLLAQIAKFTIITFGLVTALGTLGVNVSAIVGGLGLTGFAIGFAMKDILSNVVSGTLLLIFQPFQIKDEITVTGFEGKVVNIELRYTVLQKENKFILIPNSSIFTNPVVIIPAVYPDVAVPTRFIPE